MSNPWEDYSPQETKIETAPWEDYTPTPQVTVKPSQEQGFFSRVGEDYSRRFSPESMVDLTTDNSLITSYNKIGNAAGFVGVDLPMQGLRSAYRTLTSPTTQETISGLSSGIGSLLNQKTPTDPYAGVAGVPTPMVSVTEVLGEAGKQYEGLRQEYPNIIKPLEATANIAMAVPVVKGITKGVTGLTKSAYNSGKEGINIYKDLKSMTTVPTNPEELSSMVAQNAIQKRKVVEDGLRSAGIKPKDPKMQQQFYDKATVAVDKILENSTESIVKSSNPLMATEQGIKETLRKLYGKVDEAIQSAGEVGIKNTNQLKAIDDLLSPSSADYSVLTQNEKTVLADLKARRKELIKTPESSAQQLQSLMQSYNEGANNFNFSKFNQRVNAKLHQAAAVDLETRLGELGIKGRPELLKEYGAVREIQDQIARKALAETGKIDISYLDILSTAAAAHGIIMASPELLMSAMLVEGARQGVKQLKNPNRIVRKVFGKVEAINDRAKLNLKSDFFQNRGGIPPKPPTSPILPPENPEALFLRQKKEIPPAPPSASLMTDVEASTKAKELGVKFDGRQQRSFSDRTTVPQFTADINGVTTSFTVDQGQTIEQVIADLKQQAQKTDIGLRNALK